MENMNETQNTAGTTGKAPVIKHDYKAEVLAGGDKARAILDQISEGGNSPWIWDLQKTYGKVNTELTDIIINDNQNGTGKHCIGITANGRGLISKKALLAFINKTEGKVICRFRTQTFEEVEAGFKALVAKQNKTDKELKRLERGMQFTPFVGLPVFIDLVEEGSKGMVEAAVEEEAPN